MALESAFATFALVRHNAFNVGRREPRDSIEVAAEHVYVDQAAWKFGFWREVPPVTRSPLE